LEENTFNCKKICEEAKTSGSLNKGSQVKGAETGFKKNQGTF